MRFSKLMSNPSDSTSFSDMLFTLLGLDKATDEPRWQSADGRGAQPFLEDRLRANRTKKPEDPSRFADTIHRELLARLHMEGLASAAAHAAAWLRGTYSSDGKAEGRHFDALLQVEARSATRPHRIDAVLYVDGVALAIIISEKKWKDAAERLAILEESCPAWFMTPVFLVALGRHSAAVTSPGLADDRWHTTDLGTLAAILRPDALLRSTLCDSIVPRRPGQHHRSLLSPGTIRAMDLCRARALQSRPGLVSIAEGAEELAAIRSLVVRLTGEHLRAVVVCATEAQEDRLAPLFADLDVQKPEYGLNVNRVVIAQLSRLAELHGMGFPVTPANHVIIAFGVDAGFLGERGFALRLLIPDAPWISFTTLPPDAVRSEVRHAVSDPQDDAGFLAIVDTTKGRVPVREERVAFPMEHAAGLILPRLPTTKLATTLILVSSPEEAAEIKSALAGANAQVHDATQWGRAHEGWRLLTEPTSSVVVVRASLPFWASVPHLDAVFVVRRVGETTLARLRNMLSRPRPGKENAFLLLSVGHILQPSLLSDPVA